MRSLIFLITIIILITSCDSKISDIEKEVLPTQYSSDRFYLAPITNTGDTLLFYTDTGGGTNMLYEQTVNNLKLEAEWRHQGDDSVRVVEMPAFTREASIPEPPPLDPLGKKLVVIENQGHTGSGFLGRLWFATRIWEFNYPDQTLSRLPKIDWSGRSQDHRVQFGFKTDSTGRPTTYFPRVTIEVDGDSIDVLFDTGATASLSKDAAAQLNIAGGNETGTSFITESNFKKWQKNHPDWQIINNADQALQMPMIKVPKVKIANYEVGPVWFTMRPDKNFTEYMSQWMDKKIEGAIGGSVLKYFKIIVDYPNQIAEFQKMDE